MIYDKSCSRMHRWGNGCVVLPRCSVCEQVPPGGLRDGIRLKKAFICSRCEKLIVHSDVASFNYKILIEKLKRILL